LLSNSDHEEVKVAGIGAPTPDAIRLRGRFETTVEDRHSRELFFPQSRDVRSRSCFDGVVGVPSLGLSLVLATDSQALDDLLVAVCVATLQIVQEAAAPIHHHQQAAPGRVIFLVELEMLRQLRDSLAQYGDLYFGRTAIFRVYPVLFNDRRFFYATQGHLGLFLFSSQCL
jgi:hypothetical protein